jgi:carboxypeptidase PM20D1
MAAPAALRAAATAEGSGRHKAYGYHRASMKRVLLFLGLAILVLAAIVLVRTFSVTSMQIAAPPAPPLAIDRAAALARFSRAIQFRTVSLGENSPTTEHDAFVAWLATAYPRVHASLQREVVNGHSLLFTWRGSDPSLAPLLLMGHYDVVPVEGKWEQPPFSGAVLNGFVWGRGTLDDKVTVISILEATESLLAEGYRPKRTLLFAFGHDEELGGMQGAANTAKLLLSRGVKLDAVIDEGGLIVRRTLGLTRPLAVIGIAEKGSVSVELRVNGQGGHSSMPPARTPVGVVAEAVDRVQSHPMPSHITGATKEMLRWLAPHLPFGQRMVMSNLWLFKPALDAKSKTSNALNAMLRTTTAPTIITGGVKDNVIASEARAVINFRILPGDTTESVAAHVRESIDGDAVKMQLLNGTDPSPVSDARTRQFRTLQRTISQVYPDAVVAPNLMVGGTDARHFVPLTPNVYRFLPVMLDEKELDRFHGLNERIGVDDYFQVIRFYRTLITNGAR